MQRRIVKESGETTLTISGALRTKTIYVSIDNNENPHISGFMELDIDDVDLLVEFLKNELEHLKGK